MNAMRAMKVGLWALAAWYAPLAWSQPTQFEAFVTTGFNSTPIGITNAADGSGRLFVIEQGGGGQPGRVRVITSGVLQAGEYLSLSGSTQCRPSPAGALATVGFTGGGERGLLGLAFHPNYESNGHVFVSFTDANGDTYLARFTASNPAANTLSAADLGTCVVLIRVDQDGANHNGGHIAFGPDGNLYVGMGDGGGGQATPDLSGGNDGCNRGQTLNPANLVTTNNCASDGNFTGSGGNANSRALLGKMLRIDVNNSTVATANSTLCSSAGDGSANYAVPASNPFSGNDPSAACDEVWAYGLRNPWRWGFDRQTGDLIIGDVGQISTEEVSFQLAASSGGQNYGWNPCEGPFVRGSTSTACNLAGSVLPIISYGHVSSRCSITGGYRYRGPVTSVQGQYFYADYCTGEIWSSSESGGNWSPPGTPLQNLSTIPTFGEDEAGNLYIANGSQVWRLNGPTAPADQVFANGFE
jgi:hypothetical protein